MAITDTFSGSLKIELEGKLARTGGGGMTGEDKLNHSKTQSFTDGSGSNNASCWLTGSFTATTDGITVSLADSADPFGAAGDDIPTADPEGLDLRAIVIQNTDTSNYVQVGLGTNGVTQWLGGTTPTIKIGPGGIFAQTFPTDIGALNDGADDEIKITANTASCTVKVSVLFG